MPSSWLGTLQQIVIALAVVEEIQDNFVSCVRQLSFYDNILSLWCERVVTPNLFRNAISRLSLLFEITENTGAHLAAIELDADRAAATAQKGIPTVHGSVFEYRVAAESCCRVAQFLPANITVHEVDVSNERRIVLSCIDDIGFRVADQGASSVRTAELFFQFQTRHERRRSEGGDGARRTSRYPELGCSRR